VAQTPRTTTRTNPDQNSDGEAENRPEQKWGVPGRWAPGGPSPNPGGRPAVLREVRELARQHTTYAIQRLRVLTDDEDGRVALGACVALLDRAWGRPESSLTVDATVMAAPVDVERLRADLLARLTRMTATPALPAAPSNGLLETGAPPEQGSALASTSGRIQEDDP